MNNDLRKRLDKIQDSLAPVVDKSGVLFIPLQGETDEEMDERIERWCAGEKVEGQEKLCRGGNQMVARINFVEAKCPYAS